MRKVSAWIRSKALFHPTVRTRILAAMLSLCALALVGAGSTAYFLQRGQVDHRMDESLKRNATELQHLADTGVNPFDGQPFTSAEEVVIATMQLTVPSRSAGILGLRADRKPLISGQDIPVRLEQDAELVAAVSGELSSDSVVLRSITTSRSTYRVLIAPVRVTLPTAETPQPAAESSQPSAGSQPTAALVLAYDRDVEHAVFDSVFRSYVIVGAAALLVIALVGWVISGRLLQPIRVLARTAQRINDTDLSARITVAGKDDLSELGHTFNAMIDRLEGSFDSQRRLLDDVGHELRTPVTIVQGHLELMDVSDVDDVIGTRDLALDELARMNRIVNDLMTLASIDQPDFVQVAPCDIGRLTDNVLDKSRPLGDRVWHVAARADVTAQVDAQRITQAWLQLTSNAVRFSAPGSRITLGSQVSEGGLVVELWVKDEGAGIDAANQERIFDRFERVHPPQGGTPASAQRGTGLGLPIVRAIAQAHGGTVSVESAPGTGSTFTISLPVDLAAVGDSSAESPISNANPIISLANNEAKTSAEEQV